MDYIVEEPIDLADLLGKYHHPKAGAVVLFSGEARNHHMGKAVDFLEYESYKPMAERVIREIVDEAMVRWELHQAICIHRVGRVDISMTAVVVITTASHREEAYAANRYIIDRVKKDVPVWKKEHFSDGTSEWTGCDHCMEVQAAQH